MITLTSVFLTIASLTNYNVDFYAYLYNDCSISDIKVENNKIEFEFDFEYYFTFETNSYTDFVVASNERIGQDLFSVFIELDQDYTISLLKAYKIDFDITYAELIVNIDNYTLNFDIDINIYAIRDDDVQYYEYYSISRTIDINTAEQFTIQNTYELEKISTHFTFAPRNHDNTVYQEGYEQGKNDQTQSEEIWQLFDVIFNVANNILSVEILPGIRLWYLVGIPVFFLLLQFILNLFR